jgi:hypothetical protein
MRLEKKVLGLFALAAFALAGMIIIKVKRNEPPGKEITRARKMLSEAESMRSPRFAEELYTEAAAFYDSAMFQWSRENEKFILLRNYDIIKNLAERSAECSESAIDLAKKHISRVEDVLELRMETLGKQLERFEENFGSFPVSTGHRQQMARCRLQFTEGMLAYEHKDYATCNAKLDWVEATVNELFISHEAILGSYLNGYAEWKEMAVQTVEYSRRNKTCTVVIDKLARELVIYKNGKAFRSFTVELGDNWMGDKQQQGDRSTPEGSYKIIDKKSGGQTRYYKALLLDYPNEADEKKFLVNKKNGVINQAAMIGGLIEIHGHGGKGADWTDGCIALKDADMDEIFRCCTVGTKVTIVGSARSPEELSLK